MRLERAAAYPARPLAPNQRITITSDEFNARDISGHDLERWSRRHVLQRFLAPDRNIRYLFRAKSDIALGNIIIRTVLYVVKYNATLLFFSLFRRKFRDADNGKKKIRRSTILKGKRYNIVYNVL